MRLLSGVDPLVDLQVRKLREGFPAFLADVRPLSGMFSQVYPEPVPLLVFLVARRTLVRPLSSTKLSQLGMCRRFFPEFFFGKAIRPVISIDLVPIAQVRLVIFLARHFSVSFHVRLQIVQRHEAFPAQRTHVWLVARVDHRVRLQVALLRERLPTRRTLVRLLAGVAFRVRSQEIDVRKRFLALFAPVDLLTVRRRHVQPQVSRQLVRLSARLALERLLVRMYRRHVYLQSVRLQKRFSTQLALIRLLSRVRFHVSLKLVERGPRLLTYVTSILIFLLASSLFRRRQSSVFSFKTLASRRFLRTTSSDAAFPFNRFTFHFNVSVFRTRRRFLSFRISISIFAQNLVRNKSGTDVTDAAV